MKFIIHHHTFIINKNSQCGTIRVGYFYVVRVKFAYLAVRNFLTIVKVVLTNFKSGIFASFKASRCSDLTVTSTTIFLFGSKDEVLTYKKHVALRRIKQTIKADLALLFFILGRFFIILQTYNLLTNKVHYKMSFFSKGYNFGQIFYEK